MLFVNGLPLVVIELKNPADENATIWTAWNQIQTYKDEIPSLFAYNEALVISDGVEARIGTLTAGREWFKPWRTVTGESLAPATMPELHVLLEGMFERRRFGCELPVPCQICGQSPGTEIEPYLWKAFAAEERLRGMIFKSVEYELQIYMISPSHHAWNLLWASSQSSL